VNQKGVLDKRVTEELVCGEKHIWEEWNACYTVEHMTRDYMTQLLVEDGIPTS
jgi:hypothetical protein